LRGRAGKTREVILIAVVVKAVMVAMESISRFRLSRWEGITNIKNKSMLGKETERDNGNERRIGKERGNGKDKERGKKKKRKRGRGIGTVATAWKTNETRSVGSMRRKN
jgi:hypothetical protein